MPAASARPTVRPSVSVAVRIAAEVAALLCNIDTDRLMLGNQNFKLIGSPTVVFCKMNTVSAAFVL